MTNNIIDFQKAKSKKMQEKFDEMTNDIMDDEDFIHEFTAAVMVDIVEAMYDYGFDIRDRPNSVYDIMCTYEAIRSIMSRTKDLGSPLHQLNIKMFGPPDDSNDLDAEELLASFIEDLEIELD